MAHRRFWMIESRFHKGLKQYELAKKCGVSTQHISHIEVGKRSPSGVLAKKIAEELDIDMSLFYVEDESA